MATYTLQQLAELVGGQVYGDASVEISNALPHLDANSQSITLADSKQQAIKVNALTAAAVVVSQVEQECLKPQLVVAQLHKVFTQLVTLFRPIAAPCKSEPHQHLAASANISPTAQIGRDTTIGERATIGSNCSIGERCTIHAGVSIMDDCRLGDDCEIFPGVVLYPQTVLGSRVLIHANAVLGAYGFGYRQVNGAHVRTAQLGWVEVCDDVEIGAGTTIDRGTYGSTKIGAGTKIDNQVQIGHNCHLGQHNLICAQVGIAGSCTTGDYVVMAGQVGLADHLHIADRATIAAQAGLMNDVAPGAVLVGSPAGPIKQKMTEWAVASKLPELRKELRSLVKRVDELSRNGAEENIRNRDAA